jgi:hypothetical protein
VGRTANQCENVRPQQVLPSNTNGW